MAVDWGYYDNEKFDAIDEKYLPQSGEGETMASQIMLIGFMRTRKMLGKSLIKLLIVRTMAIMKIF